MVLQCIPRPEDSPSWGRRASSWVNASVFVLTTVFVSKLGVPMNYGDTAMEQAIMHTAGALLGGTSNASLLSGNAQNIALVRRSPRNIYTLCWALRKRARHGDAQGLFIDIPGLIYGPSPRGLHLLNLTRNAASCARRAGLRVYMVPHSLYSFKAHTPEATAMRQMLQLFDEVHVRDESDMAVAQDVLSLPSTGPSQGFMQTRPRLVIEPDFALVFTASCAADATAFLRKHVGSLERPVVTIDFGRRALESWPGTSYLDTYREVVRQAIAIFGREQVVLVAHERGRFGPHEHDDRYWTRKTALEFGLATTVMDDGLHDGGKATLAALESMGATENRYVRFVDAVIGQASLHIASRFHAAVAALREHVPIVCLTWGPKYAALLHRYSGASAEAVRNSMLISFNDTIVHSGADQSEGLATRTGEGVPAEPLLFAGRIQKKLTTAYRIYAGKTTASSASSLLRTRVDAAKVRVVALLCGQMVAARLQVQGLPGTDCGV